MNGFMFVEWILSHSDGFDFFLSEFRHFYDFYHLHGKEYLLFFLLVQNIQMNELENKNSFHAFIVKFPLK